MKYLANLTQIHREMKERYTERKVQQCIFAFLLVGGNGWIV